MTGGAGGLGLILAEAIVEAGGHGRLSRSPTPAHNSQRRFLGRRLKDFSILS